MDSPRFYNSLSKKIEKLEPLNPGKIRIYNCGPTVYKRQHIGNMRRYLFADFLRRTLEMAGFEVREIMNITDVGHLTQDDVDAGEDKLEAQARKEQKTPQDIANEQIRLFKEDLQALNIQTAHKYPRASEHIPGMHSLIEALIKNGHAYQTDSGVYFDVASFPTYGNLSGNTLENINAGARIEVREEKKHPADFALWKINDPNHLQQWDSPWGRGYPGWHIECSAMALEYLGSEIDIHTGGEDNRFPHHENEIAQSEGATQKPFVRHWMHNRHLLFDGKKLAKREGLQITLDTLREKGYSPLAFRLFVFSSHYRSPLDFSWEAMHQAQANLETIKTVMRKIHERTQSTTEESPTALPADDIHQKFLHALLDDLNTPAALAVVLEYIRTANTLLDTSRDAATAFSIRNTLLSLDGVLGIIKPLQQELLAEIIPTEIQELATQREAARKAGEYEKADVFRVAIEKAGFKIEDTSSGPRIVKS